MRPSAVSRKGKVVRSCVASSATSARGRPWSSARGARKLEYRGYDSAGVCLLGGDGVRDGASGRQPGRAARRRARARRGRRRRSRATATIGIGHTRWATTGASARPTRTRTSTRRRRPHRRQRHRRELPRPQAPPRGHGRRVHLRDRRRGHRAPHRTSPRRRRPRRRRPARLRRARGSLRVRRAAARAARRARRRPQGVPADRRPRRRRALPRLGRPGVPRADRRVQYVENDEIVAIRPRRDACSARRGRAVEREIESSTGTRTTAEKGGYETFMLKEIHEQADALAETIADRTVAETASTSATELDETLLRDAKRIVIVACGTSYHAASDRPVRDRGVGAGAGRASTSRPSTATRDPLVGPGDLVIGITQSGETADTLAAMRRRAASRRDRARAHERHGLAGHPRRGRHALHPRRPRGRASRRPRRSSPRSRSCSCSRCGSPSCAG